MKAVYLSTLQRGCKFRFTPKYDSPIYVKSESYYVGDIRVYLSTAPRFPFYIKKDRVVWIS